MKKILYLHGKGSHPGGTKPTFLSSRGYEVINPALPDSSFEDSVNIAKKAIQNHRPDVIVASSRGGAVALAAADNDARMVLMCPAWKTFGVRLPESLPNTTLLHAKEDDIVAYEDSNFLVEKCGTVLITCGKDHRMIDTEPLNALEDVLLSYRD